MNKLDLAKLEYNLRSVLAKNNRILAIMKMVESAEIPPGRTALEVLAEELERQDLMGAFDETKK